MSAVGQGSGGVGVQGWSDPRGQVSARYRRLYDFFAAAEGDLVALREKQLDELIDGGLPDRARAGAVIRSEWWTNNPSRGWARAWLNAGWVWNGSSGGRWPRVLFVRGQGEDPSLDDLRAARARHRHAAISALGAPFKPPEFVLRLGWREPHLVYVVHITREGQFKVGVTRVGARRLRALGVGRDAVLVETLEVPNRLVAEVVESDVLDMVEPWHCLGDQSRPVSGYTERWSEDGPDVDLAAVFRESVIIDSQTGLLLDAAAIWRLYGELNQARMNVP